MLASCSMITKRSTLIFCVRERARTHACMPKLHVNLDELDDHQETMLGVG